MCLSEEQNNLLKTKLDFRRRSGNFVESRSIRTFRGSVLAAEVTKRSDVNDLETGKSSRESVVVVRIVRSDEERRDLFEGVL
jgi:hypothetical protein